MEWTAILALLAQVDWVQVFTIIITILFFISEALGNIPQVESNSVYQLAKKIITAIKNGLPKQGSKKPKHREEITKEE